ncbi:MAG: VOC family protein [Alphaproteobacteria bacterium]|nr:VOC family protein [Alphaproteobacteria bacterium]
MSSGLFVWHDHMSKDIQAPLAFYEALLGWTHKDMPTPMGPYPIFHDGQQEHGGFVAMEDAGHPPHWMPYVTVDDLDKAVQQVPELGGGVDFGPMPIPNVGRFAIIHDNQGAHITLIQLNEVAKPPAQSPQPGQFCWYTLNTPDVAASIAFWSALVGWTVKDVTMGGSTQAICHLGEHQIAGMVPLAEGDPRPPHWALSICVANLDDTLARSAALGGQVLMPPTPLGSFGKMAAIADPAGAGVGLFEFLGG